MLATPGFDLRLELRRIGALVRVVIGADFGRDRESRAAPADRCGSSPRGSRLCRRAAASSSRRRRPFVAPSVNVFRIPAAALCPIFREGTFCGSAGSGQFDGFDFARHGKNSGYAAGGIARRLSHGRRADRLRKAPTVWIQAKKDKCSRKGTGFSGSHDNFASQSCAGDLRHASLRERPARRTAARGSSASKARRSTAR